MAEIPGLFGLPLVIFRSILEELHLEDREAFYNFRLVSRACRAHSEVLLFRSLTIQNRTDDVSWMNQYLIKRLQDPKDPIVQHVRHFQIGPFLQKRRSPHPSTIERALKNFDNLQSFRWNVPYPMPKVVLDRFHASLPSTFLHVDNSARVDLDYETRKSLPLDKNLLSSLQLHSLIVSVFRDFDDGRTSDGSELEILRACLLSARRLRSLKLHVTSSFKRPWEDEEFAPYNLQLQPGDIMPSLETLTLLDGNYYFSEDHCQLWKTCMDWKQLRVLELKRAPRHLFRALTGAVPELRCLRFCLEEDRYTNDTDRDVDLTAVGCFLAAINGLEEMEIGDDSLPLFSKLFGDLMKKHGQSLRKFSLLYDRENRPHFYHPWPSLTFAQLLNECPRLQNLAVDVDLEDESQTAPPCLIWSKTTTELLVQFQDLRYLHLNLCLRNGNARIFCLHYSYMMTSIDELEALGVVTGLFNGIIQANPSSAIEEVKLSILLSSPQKEWHFTAKRKRNVPPGQERFVVQKEFKNSNVTNNHNPNLDPTWDPFG